MKSSALFIMSLASFLTYSAVAQDFTKHPVVSGYNSWSAVAVDLDDDGDQDIIGSSRLTSRVSWWENDGAENFTLHLISTNAAFAMAVCAVDLDSDADIDVVSAVQEANAIIWWENNGEEAFTQHILASVLSPSDIDTCDLDQDNDMDILVAACEEGSNKIVWCENIDNLNFTVHIIQENWDHANSVQNVDMDLDGDIDVLATASFRTHPTADGEIAWFENDGNQNFTKHTIIGNYGRPSCAVAVDFDNDLDMDVVATVCLLNRIVLFENNGDLTFTTVVIASNLNRPHCVFTANLDNDLDIDILGTCIDGNQIAWWENTESGFTQQIISTSFGGASSVTAGDLDEDGDMDVLASAQYDNEIAWWENTLITGTGEADKLIKQSKYLYQNFPNPFSESTCIRFILPIKSPVTLTIYDISGKLKRTLITRELSPGDYSITWDGRSDDGTPISQGCYYYRLKTNFLDFSGKMMKGN